MGLHAGCRSNEPGFQPLPGPGGGLRIPVEFILPSQAADRADESGHPAAVVHAAEPFVLFAVNGFVRTVRIGGIRPVIKGIADIFMGLRFFSEQAFFLSKGDDGCVQRTAMHHGKEKRREREKDEPKPPKCHYPIQAGTFCRDNREMEQCPDFFAEPFPAAFPVIWRRRERWCQPVPKRLRPGNEGKRYFFPSCLQAEKKK